LQNFKGKKYHFGKIKSSLKKIVNTIKAAAYIFESEAITIESEQSESNKNK
jgi:hypothetical protein